MDSYSVYRRSKKVNLCIFVVPLASASIPQLSRFIDLELRDLSGFDLTIRMYRIFGWFPNGICLLQHAVKHDLLDVHLHSAMTRRLSLAHK